MDDESHADRKATNVPPIVQLSTVHPRRDTRIYHRHLVTLAQFPERKLFLLVADGLGSKSERIGTGVVDVLDLGIPPGGRIGRVIVGSFRALAAVRGLKAAVVHFHDPELIPAAMVMKLLGCKVVYDVHEDYPLQILHKHWLPRWLRSATARVVKLIERTAAVVFNAVVCATPRIAERFPVEKTVVVRNFPILSELAHENAVPYATRASSFVYVGSIAAIRGARDLVEAIQMLPEQADAHLDLAGNASPASLMAELQAMPGWTRVRYHGWADRRDVAQLLGAARAGIVVLHRTHNYPEAYPVKMFEYMAAGLPVIASDFPVWRNIVESARCGLLVEPANPGRLAEAMDWILKHPAEAEHMGRRGALAVAERYNWSKEAQKLVHLYEKLR